MTLIYSDPLAAVLFWVTFFAFVVLDGRLIARALSGRETAGPPAHAQGLVHRPRGLIWISVAEFLGFAAAAVDPLVLPGVGRCWSSGWSSRGSAWVFASGRSARSDASSSARS